MTIENTGAELRPITSDHVVSFGKIQDRPSAPPPAPPRELTEDEALAKYILDWLAPAGYVSDDLQCATIDVSHCNIVELGRDIREWLAEKATK